jgi:hypothetical protein
LQFIKETLVMVALATLVLYSAPGFGRAVHRVAAREEFCHWLSLSFGGRYNISLVTPRSIQLWKVGLSQVGESL